MKRCRKLLILICVTLLISGCEFKDIDKRFFVVSIGIDKSKDTKKKYQVTMKMAIPSGTVKMGAESFKNFSQDSDSITDAIQTIKAELDKEPDFGHTKALIISEEVAKEDYRYLLDWFVRQRFIQKVAFVGIGKPSAASVLAVKPNYERLPSNALFLTFGQVGVESQYIITQDLFEVYRNSKDAGYSPIIPVIEAQKDHFLIHTVAAMNDRRIVLTLSPSETRLINLLKLNMQKMDFAVQTMGNTFMVHTDKIDSVTKGHFSEKTPYIQINVKIEGLVEERVKETKLTVPVLLQINRALEQEINQEILSLLTKLQKQKIDPLGFGLLYFANNWDSKETEERNWKSIYPKLSFRVQTSANLRAPGEIE